MRFRYSEWDEDLIRRLLASQGLMRLFNHLLLQTNGDVDEALGWMKYMQEQGHIPDEIDLEDFIKKLREDRIIQKNGEKFNLTPKGEKQIRQDSLDMIFSSLKSDSRGEHPIGQEGLGSAEPLPEQRPYEFGDTSGDIDFNASIGNALKRAGIVNWSLTEPDLSVRQTEAATTCATVLLLDISHSMILYGEDRITPAKQVAMAFAEMILTKFKRDALNVVVFGDDAREIKVEDLAYIGVGRYHTNTQAGLRAARQILLQRKHHNKQIFMITDGKPSVIRKANGQLYKNVVQKSHGPRSDHCQPHAGRGGNLPQEKDHHYHVHGHFRSIPAAICAEADQAQPRPGVFHATRPPGWVYLLGFPEKPPAAIAGVSNSD